MLKHAAAQNLNIFLKIFHEHFKPCTFANLQKIYIKKINKNRIFYLLLNCKRFSLSCFSNFSSSTFSHQLHVAVLGVHF